MNEERELAIEMLKSLEKRNSLMEKALNCAVALFVLLLVTFTEVMTTTVISYNNTLAECTRLYFETDYDYGEQTIEQSIEVK